MFWFWGLMFLGCCEFRGLVFLGFWFGVWVFRVGFKVFGPRALGFGASGS